MQQQQGALMQIEHLTYNKTHGGEKRFKRTLSSSQVELPFQPLLCNTATSRPVTRWPRQGELVAPIQATVSQRCLSSDPIQQVTSPNTSIQKPPPNSPLITDGNSLSTVSATKSTTTKSSRSTAPEFPPDKKHAASSTKHSSPRLHYDASELDEMLHFRKAMRLGQCERVVPPLRYCPAASSPEMHLRSQSYPITPAHTWQGPLDVRARLLTARQHQTASRPQPTPLQYQAAATVGARSRFARSHPFPVLITNPTPIQALPSTQAAESVHHFPHARHQRGKSGRSTGRGSGSGGFLNSIELGALTLEEAGRSLVGRFKRSEMGTWSGALVDEEGKDNSRGSRESARGRYGGDIRGEKRKGPWGMRIASGEREKKGDEEEAEQGESSEEDFWCIGPRPGRDLDMLINDPSRSSSPSHSSIDPEDKKQKEKKTTTTRSIIQRSEKTPSQDRRPPADLKADQHVFPSTTHHSNLISPPSPPYSSDEASLWIDDLGCTVYDATHTPPQQPRVSPPLPPLRDTWERSSQKEALSINRRSSSSFSSSFSSSSSSSLSMSSSSFGKRPVGDVRERLRRWSERHARGGRRRTRRREERDAGPADGGKEATRCETGVVEVATMPSLVDMVETALRRRTSFYDFWGEVLEESEASGPGGVDGLGM